MKSLHWSTGTAASICCAIAPLLAYAKDPQVRVGLGYACPSSYTGSATQPEVAAIFAAIAADLALQATTSLIDKFNTYLTTDKAVKVEDTFPVDTLLSSDGKKTTFDSSVQCIWVVVANDFQPPKLDGLGQPASTQASETPPLSEIVPFTDIANPQAVVDFTGAKSRILYYYEAKVKVQSPNGNAWRLIPQYVYYPKFLHSSNIFQSSTHDFSMTLQYSAPAHDSAPFATYNLSYPSMSEGGLTTSEALSKGTGWLPFPSDPGGPTAGSPSFYPVNVTAQVIETRHPNELATIIGKTSEDKKADIANLASSKTLLALSQDARFQSASTATDAAKAALEDYNKAYDDAKAALAAYNAAPDADSKARALNAVRVEYQLLNQAKTTVQSKMAAAGIRDFKPYATLQSIP